MVFQHMKDGMTNSIKDKKEEETSHEGISKRVYSMNGKREWTIKYTKRIVINWEAKRKKIRNDWYKKVLEIKGRKKESTYYELL